MKRLSTLFSVNLLCGVLLNQATAMQEHHQPTAKSTQKHQSTEAPEYVTAFINLFKHGNITAHDFDQKIFQAFSIINVNAMFIPMKKLHILASHIEASDTKEAVFNLFDELEAQQPNQLNNTNRKLFFILNYLLGNPEAISLAKQYLNEFMQTTAWIDPSYATYAYVLLDSGLTEYQELALGYFKKIMNDPNAEGNFATIVQQLISIKDQQTVSGFVQAIIQKLPEMRQNNAWGALQTAGTLLNHPLYHQEALSFIEDTLKLNEIQGQNPYILVIQVLSQNPSSEKYAMDLLETIILPKMALGVKHKAQAVQALQGKGAEKGMGYLDVIWDIHSDDKDRVQLIFEMINFPQYRKFLFSKVMEYLGKIYKLISTMPEHEIGMYYNNLLNFFTSLDFKHTEMVRNEMHDLLDRIIQLPPHTLTMINASGVITLIQKLGLKEMDLLTKYSQSSTFDPQFFTNLSYQIPDREHFLTTLCQSNLINPQLKEKILTEFAASIEWNPNLLSTLIKGGLVKDILPHIQQHQLHTLLLKPDINAEEILLTYSENPTVNPHTFIHASSALPEKEKFLWRVYKSSKTDPQLKVSILKDFASQYNWDQTIQGVVSKEDLIKDLFNMLDTPKEFSDQISLYHTLLNFNEPHVNKNIIIYLAKELKSTKTTDHKIQLFSIVSSNTNIDKKNEKFEEMFEEIFKLLLSEIKNPQSHNISHIIMLLKHSNPESLHIPFLKKLESINLFRNTIILFEDKIKREVFEIDIQGATELNAHSTLAIKKLKFVLGNLLKDFHSYDFQGVPFEHKDLIEKTRALLSDKDLIHKALEALGKEEITSLTNNAIKNVDLHLNNETKWNEPNHEVESIKIDGNIITVGQIYSLFIYYIDRQKGKESYLPLIATLVQALASDSLMQGCGGGSMSGMGNTIFKEEFKQEGKEIRSYKDYQEVVNSKLDTLKTIMIYLLSQHKTGEHTFDIHNKLLVKYFPEIEKNEFLIEMFQIFNQMPLENIFGKEIHTIDQLFMKLDDYKYVPSAEESNLIKDVYALIINPTLLALLAKEYSDFVVFTPNLRDPSKLSFPDFVSLIEEDDLLPYKPKLIENFLSGK